MTSRPLDCTRCDARLGRVGGNGALEVRLASLSAIVPAGAGVALVCKCGQPYGWGGGVVIMRLPLPAKPERQEPQA